MKRNFFAALVFIAITSVGLAQAADINSGKALVEKNNCGSCHGADLKTPVAPGYPKIAGQHADYLFNALNAYKVTGNPNIGRSNAIMGGQVKALSKTDLQNIAAYVASLPSDLVVKK